MKRFPVLFFFIAVIGCDNSKPVGPQEWLKGDDQKKFETIANQLRGFETAMMETGYRYQELYWAGKDGNWEYASHQLDKMKTAINAGLERRPSRAASAENFLNGTLPEVKEALQSRDSTVFMKTFQLLTTNCNNCHIMEKVPYIQVSVPQVRLSPVKKQ